MSVISVTTTECETGGNVRPLQPFSRALFSMSRQKKQVLNYTKKNCFPGAAFHGCVAAGSM